jgi:dipeptidyl aminopeptidase/acylaminoacyl peptidase
MIALLGTLRYPGTFGAAVAIAPVTNLFHRLAAKGVDSQLRVIDPHGRFGGLPSQRPDVYRDRSPLFQLDRLQDPLLVHMADNDEDVTIEEGAQLIDALTARKPSLAETRIYHSPRGGHMFDRQVDGLTFQPEGTSDQLDSWRRVWAFLERHLGKRR